MSKRTSFVATLLIMQTGCFTAGIWLQHFCLRWTTREDLWKKYVVALAREGNRLLAKLEPSDPEALVRVFNATSTQSVSCGVAVVDSGWNVLAESAGSAGKWVGKVLPWRPSAAGGEPRTGGAIGSFAVDDARYFAVARPLGPGRGFLVVHRSEAALENDISAILSGLNEVSFITLLWVAALMGICSYIITGKFCDDAERERSKAMIEALRQRQNLIRTRDAVIFGLAKLTESRDPETGDHLDRISMYATTLATALMNHPDFKEQVTPSFVRLIGISAALHDIGKVGVEDRILLKPGKLTASERTTMEDHSRIGGECLTEIERRLGQSNFLHMARDIAFSHHERWDGSGYPHGLRGEQIPLAARIVAIADVYDALSSRRVYKEPLSHEQCTTIVREGAGTHFDPRLVEVWLTVAARFRDIAERFSDRRTQTFEDPEASSSPFAKQERYRTLAAVGAGGNSELQRPQ